ncbi:hypothetical protein GQ55_3G437800 [Panicum hallii var. hallii]|uniref:Uncharacterized protein n=1 Tax=Panicum hallii var. hallii TaxID=1504633 RepID=A0A2T7EI23_9POAL|nr:hypothetical protein GQ55_3G437800 [Panicum hallii var. hallii]
MARSGESAPYNRQDVDKMERLCSGQTSTSHGRVHWSIGVEGGTTSQDRMERLIFCENLKFGSVTWGSIPAGISRCGGCYNALGVLDTRVTGLVLRLLRPFWPIMLIVTLLSADAPRIR